MDIRSTRIFQLWQRYEHHLGVGALLVGFSFDFFLAKRPDSVIDNSLLVSYLFIAGAFIIVLNLQKSRRGQEWEPFFLLLILQFCFGGLSSNLLVLYGKSGTLTTSALFIALLVSLVFGNEFLRSRYSLLRFNVGVYFILLLTYATIAVPTFITHAVGPVDFLLSGLISLVFIAVFLTLLFFTVFRGRDTRSLRGVSILVGVIFVVFNVLYFLNIIPPVPLSLKDIGIYHSVLKDSSGNYVALYEPAPWWEFWAATNGTYEITPSDSTASCFSSVFAPTDLTGTIYHRWEYYDPTQKAWVTESLVSFAISGGRAQGYRGYTTVSNLTTGAWRCDVETAQGQLIGRTDFTVVEASSTPSLSQTTL